ncbi:MAG: VanZ family protein [Pyrinomonadaceae bacterium]
MADLTSSRRRWLTAYAPLIIWIVVIVGLGSSVGAMNETSRFIRPLLEFLFPTADPATLTFYHGLIRKGAHVFEYAVLGFLAYRVFGFVKGRPAIHAIILVSLVAAMDELNQSFNPARTSSPWDVGLDVLGGIIGIGIYIWLFRRRTDKRDD